MAQRTELLRRTGLGVFVRTVACPVWVSQLSGLPPLKLFQVEPDVAQQHPRYRAHDRNWFSLMDAPQPRIFVEFDLDKDYCTNASLSVAQRDISSAWSCAKLRYVRNSRRPLYFHPFVACTCGFLPKKWERIRLRHNLVCGWRFAVFVVGRVVARWDVDGLNDVVLASDHRTGNLALRSVH